MAQTELERAEKRLAQAKARVQALRNREATRQRKLDTRRKVILGGALIELAARDDAARAMLDRLVRGLGREQDRAAFDGWEPEEDHGGGREEAGSEEPPSNGGGAGADAHRPAGLLGGSWPEPDDRRRPPRSGHGSGPGRGGGSGPPPPNDELRESLELLATVAASVSDRVDGQTDALDRMAKALAETRTAAFAARKQTDPRAYADQVAGLVEDRLGRTLAVLHQNAARLEHEANRVQRLTDQTRELRGDAVALKQREAHDAAEWRAERRRLLLWTAPSLLVLLLLTAVLVPRAMAASETLCTLAGAEWSPGGEYLSPSCRFDAWW